MPHKTRRKRSSTKRRPNMKRGRSKNNANRKRSIKSGSMQKSGLPRKSLRLKGRQRRLKRKSRPFKRRTGSAYVRALELSPPVQVPKLQLPEVAVFDPLSANRGASARPLTILYVVHQFFPDAYTGTEKFVLTMAKAMLRNGHRVKVASHSGQDPDRFPNAHGDVVYREYDYEGVPVLAYRNRQPDPVRSDTGNPDRASFAEAILVREKPDLLHIGHPMHAMEFMQASLRHGIPYVITLTDFWFLCPKGIMLHSSRNLCAGPERGNACLAHCQIPDAGQRLAMHIPLLQSARNLLSPSRFLASMMKYSLPDLQVEVLNHGIPYDPGLQNHKVYRRGDKLTLFYGGSLNEHKGVHLILEAMSRIRSNRLRLKIYGSGPAAYTEKLRQLASGDHRVELCGAYTESDIPHIYQNVDAAIVPSVWYENYPLALHEALSYRVPAIVSDAGGMAEKVRDGVNGLIFRLGDADHLAAKIRMLLANPALLNGLKSNISAEPVPTVEQEAYAYESIYYSLST